MSDQYLDIRCGMFLGIQLNRSVMNERIDDVVREYMCRFEDVSLRDYLGFYFADCGDTTYEDMFYKEFKSQYIYRLNNKDRVNDDDILEILQNLVYEYLDKKWINVETETPEQRQDRFDRQLADAEFPSSYGKKI